MERELSRLRIENEAAVMLRDMERSISELVERERQRNLTATCTNVIMENSSDSFILLDDHLRLLLLSHNFETVRLYAAKPGIELEELPTLLPILPQRNGTTEDIATLRRSLESIMNTEDGLKYSLTLGEGEDTRCFDMTATGAAQCGTRTPGKGLRRGRGCNETVLTKSHKVTC